MFIVSATFLIQENNAPKGLIFQAFLMGLRFDTTVLSYIFIIPFLLLFIADLFGVNLLQKISVIYLKLILLLALFISCADIPYYIQFQKHISEEAFVWVNQGTLSIKLVLSDFSYWGYLFLFIPLSHF